MRGTWCRYYRITRPDLISEEYTDPNDPGLDATLILSQIFTYRKDTDVRVADIAAVHADFLGIGKQRYQIIDY